VKVVDTEAHRAALLACVLIFVVQAVFTPIDAHTLGGGNIVWLDVAHALLAALVGAWLWTQRRRPSARSCDLAFLVVVLPFLPIAWIGESTAARLGTARDPLVGLQLVMVGIAILQPHSLRLGALLLAMFSAEAAVLWFVLRSRYDLADVAGEPWMTFLFGAMSAGLLFARASRRAMEHRLARAEASAAALARVARIFLAVRDRANTPIQKLELGIALLEKHCADERRTVGTMRRAMAQLRELSATLANVEQLEEQGAGPPGLGGVGDTGAEPRQSGSRPRSRR
jgi:hypothetical protein